MPRLDAGWHDWLVDIRSAFDLGDRYPWRWPTGEHPADYMEAADHVC